MERPHLEVVVKGRKEQIHAEAQRRRGRREDKDQRHWLLPTGASGRGLDFIDSLILRASASGGIPILAAERIQTPEARKMRALPVFPV